MPSSVPQILVVDDGDANRQLMKLVLGRSGARVEEAENGQEALDRVAGEQFDLILMDMQMPVLDGYSATKELRKRGVTIPIIAMTAHAMKGDDEHCCEAGCSGYISKPIEHDALISIVFGAIAGADKNLNEVAAAPIRQASSAHATERAEGTLVSNLPMDDADFRQIVEQYCVRLTEKITEMEIALKSHNFAELASLAHWLKGTGGGAGFPILTEFAIALERAAKAGRDDDSRICLAKIQKAASQIVVE